MEEPSLQRSRLALAGGIAAALALGGAGFVIGRGTSPRTAEPARSPPAAVPDVVTPAPAAAPEPGDAVKTRADLIALAAQAADALASGQPMPKAVADAAGQRFELRLPFGCQGPSEESGAAMRWSYDKEATTLRVHVAPVAWTKGEILDAAGQTTANDAVEGFWIPRPWTASEACPTLQDSPVPVGSDPVTLPGQTLAIAQFFGSEGSRDSLRNGKPYEAVVRMSPDEVPSSRGFQLYLTGRIARIPGQGPIHCGQPAGSEQRPICVIAVTTDDVAINNPKTGKTLATWNIASARGADR
jgi:hypothetical protein